MIRLMATRLAYATWLSRQALRDSQITSLPEGLIHIGGDLDLYKSQITSLSENIEEIVKGKIIG